MKCSPKYTQYLNRQRQKLKTADKEQDCHLQINIISRPRLDNSIAGYLVNERDGTYDYFFCFHCKNLHHMIRACFGTLHKLSWISTVFNCLCDANCNKEYRIQHVEVRSYRKHVLFCDCVKWIHMNWYQIMMCACVLNRNQLVHKHIFVFFSSPVLIYCVVSYATIAKICRMTLRWFIIAWNWVCFAQTLW